MAFVLRAKKSGDLGVRSRSLACFLFVCLLLVPAFGFAQQVAVDYGVQSDWQTGLVGQIAVKNTGAATISGWSLEFDLGGQLVGLWNAQSTVSGTHYTVRDLGWNAE